VLAIGVQNDVPLFRGLRALGISDYLLKPIDRDSLGAAIDAALAEIVSSPAQSTDPAPRARVLALVGSRGGAGTSSLAIALSTLLAREGQRTVLLDLDLQGGSLALDLGAEPTPGLAHLLKSPDRVDPLVVERALKAHRLGFRLLAVDAPVEQELALEPDALLALVAAAAKGADVLVVDCPRWLDQQRRAVLRTADRVAIISPPTLAGLRDAQRMAQFLSGLRAGQAPIHVVNRAGAQGAGLDRAEFEAGLAGPLTAWIAEDERAARHAAQMAGSLLCRGGRALAEGIAALRLALLPPPAGPVPTPTRWPAWLGGLWREARP
jgi:pilus assembly protein CpaE